MDNGEVAEAESSDTVRKHPLDDTDEKCIAYLENFRIAGQRRNSGMRNIWNRGLHVFEGLRTSWSATFSTTGESPGSQRVIFNQAQGSHLRFSTNIVLPLVQDMVAATIANRPAWVAHAGPDPQDRMADRAAQRFLDWGWQESAMDLQNLELLLLTFCCGFASLRGYWDWGKGETISTDVSALIEQHPDLMSEYTDEQMRDLMTRGGKMRLGSPAVRVVMPHNVIFDPTASRFLDAIHRRRMELNVLTMEEVRDNPFWRPHAYRVVPDRLEEDEGSDLDTGSAGAQDAHLGGSYSAWDERRVTVREYMEPPDESNGYEGRLVQYAGNVMLHRGPIPSTRARAGDWDGLPYADFFWVLRPGRLYPLGFVEQVDPLQAEYDDTRSHQRTHRKLIAKAKILVHAQAKVPAGAFTDRVGQVVKWSGMTPPAPMQMGQMPEQDSHLNRIEGAAQRLAISAESPRVSQGLTAASALAIVQEAQRTQARPVQIGIDAGWARTGMIWLDLVHDNMVIPRQAKIVGASGSAELAELNRDDLKNYDVWVEAGSSLPKSVYAQQQMAMELYTKRAILTPEGQQDPRKLAKMMRWPGMTDVYEEDLLDERNQEAENIELLKGMQVPLGPADNDLVHLRAMYPIMKAPEFKSLPLPVQMAFVLHAEMHRSRYKATLLEQQLLGSPAATPGQPAQGGPNAKGDVARNEPRPSEAQPSGNPTLDAGREAAQAAGRGAEVNMGNGGMGAG